MLRTPYPAQALAIMGGAKRWQIARGAHVVAECGAGKTLIALGMMLAHAMGRPFSAIVMAPPHLVEKWAREVFLTLANARVFLVDDMRNGGASKDPHGINEVRLRRGEIVREGLHTTLPELRNLGPRGWRKLCPQTSIFVMGRERAKLGYFWKHTYLKGRSGKHFGIVLNPDTLLLPMTNSSMSATSTTSGFTSLWRTTREVQLTIRHSGRQTGRRFSVWRQPTTWAAICMSGSITRSLTKFTSSPATRRKATLSVCWPEWRRRSPA